MELEDRLTIATAEGVELRLVLAGAASRIIAGSLDLVVEIVLLALLALAIFGLVGGGVATALFAIAVFVVAYLYNVLFEVLASGRTPGKRVSHLRVVRQQGSPVDLLASAIRNLVRLVDILPAVYLVGISSILITRQNQRLGDLAADTLVIREAPAERGKPVIASEESSRTLETDGWDVSAVSIEELAAVRRFLQRRESLDSGSRRELAHRLEQGLRPKVAGVPRGLEAERFLEVLARVKSAR